MKPEYAHGNVRSKCPDCSGAITTFETIGASSKIAHDRKHSFKGQEFKSVIHALLKCAGCGRGGLAKIHEEGNRRVLESFFPISIDTVKIPNNIPNGIIAEFREAELCASVEAWRAASALFRSTLEKPLKENGYTQGSLAEKINEASKDGIITESRRKRAHDDIRVLGNDVLHDEWREIKEGEVEESHHYIQRILEDFYDDRNTVEKILIEKGRINLKAQ